MQLETDGERLREIARQAEIFAKENVISLCRELLEWSQTSILREGRVRELANLVRPMAGSDALSVAESYAQHAAFEFVVQHRKASE